MRAEVEKIPVEPATRIAYLVRMLSNTLNQRIERALRPLELTQAQLAALAQLALRAPGRLSGAELGRRAGVTPQAMWSAVAGLEQRELVERSPHPTHGRVLEIGITEDGIDVLAQAQELTAPVDAHAMATLTDGEQRQLRALLLKSMTALDLPHPDGGDVQARVTEGSPEATIGSISAWVRRK
ncbi:MarR family transcriptional regulator [Amycolatopsis sp. WAC 04197]|uniref:MarR family winged helix-turn-helix transcriptional regulator n=1 Tax=Amycolatopsis sp. WAC 04197 TaxID=2203199 RepID=UPI000F78E308|nr:MarR family transcriptional regulator [Amycolatopsis sp. WAC 04197]RSN39896.1 MarR family transcriptional regulator [Amycolatopsis sp. WAC 04197]